MKPKVTIGVCVRNCEEYVAEAIRSISDQDFPHELIEAIFVDDGSKDRTLSILHDCTCEMDFPVKIFHTSWKGLGHARNMVVANAQGEFVLWVDGDMVLSKDFVRKLIFFMEQHPNTGISKGKQSLKPARNLLASLESYSRAAGRMVDYRSKKARLKALGTGGAIYRLEVLKEVGGFDENLRGYGEDWDVEIRVRKAGWTLGTTDAEFLDYERHGLSWRNLWKRYIIRGYYTHYFLHKNKGMIRHYRMLPPVALMSGLLQASVIYELTRQKTVFLLPLESIFKATAWYVGFLKSHFNSYSPRALGKMEILKNP